jgi:hypothetical protein
MANALKMLYSITGNSKKRSKERFETILEPLHAILQVGFLSFYPVGTKLAIKGNMLIIQPPDYTQSMARWYNSDTQDDLCYLFNVFTRFNKYYAFLSSDMPDLHSLLISNAVKGLEKLIRTYTNTNRPHILHTLNMYKQIAVNRLEYTHGIPTITMDLVTTDTNIPNVTVDKVTTTNTTNAAASNIHASHASSSSAISNSSTSNNNSIDAIFCKIVDKYSKRDLIVIYNVLLMLSAITGHDAVSSGCDGSQEDYLHYISGVNQILVPVNTSIKKWIDENIVF